MDEHDRHIVEHLAKHFGSRTFTAREASERTAEAARPQEGGQGPARTAGSGSALPSTEQDWHTTLRRLAEQGLVRAEIDGWRLAEAVLEAAGILNI